MFYLKVRKAVTLIKGTTLHEPPLYIKHLSFCLTSG